VGSSPPTSRSRCSRPATTETPTSTSSPRTGGSSIGVLLGDGTGGFEATVAASVAVGTTAADLTSLETADLDGDGGIEVVADTGTNSAVVLLEITSTSPPDHSVLSSSSLPTSFAVVGVSLGDYLDANELLVVDSRQAHAFLLDETFTYERFWTVTLPKVSAAAMAVGDVFGLDATDLALAAKYRVLSIPNPPSTLTECASVSTSIGGDLVDIALGSLNSVDGSTHDDAVEGEANGRILVVLDGGDGFD